MKKCLQLLSLSFLFYAGFIASCTSPHQGYINQVDSLNVLVDSSEKMFLSIDTSLVYGNLRTAESNFQEVSAYYDTLTREIAFLLDEYYSYKKAYKKWGGKIKPFYDEFEVVRMQLEDLKTDLEKDLIPQEKIDEYYEHEMLHIHDMMEIVVSMKTGLELIHPKFDAANEKVSLLLDSLRQENNSEL